MANETTAAPAATAQAPAQAAPAAAGSANAQAGLKGPVNPNPVAVGAAPTKKFPSTSPLVTNPEPWKDPDAPVQEVAPGALPQATIDEMAAGRKALERNRPVAAAREQASVNTPRDSDGKSTG